MDPVEREGNKVRILYIENFLGRVVSNISNIKADTKKVFTVLSLIYCPFTLYIIHGML